MRQSQNNKKWAVYVSTFPPRECGIATFTQDLSKTFDEVYAPREETKIVAMNIESKYDYERSKVIFEIPHNEEAKYIEAAKFLNNLPQVCIVNVQHEFGIYGGPNGSHIVLFLRELKKPVIITFHTVLPKPNPELHDIVAAINNHVRTIVVMTENSKRILVQDYGINPEKIKIIPHGIHSTPFSESEKFKKKIGMKERMTISTFGLLSPGKGIEFGIEAMVDVAKKYPNSAYLIIGATHPVILKNEGEKYRQQLVNKVAELKLENNVFFFNKYLDLPDLLDFINASDIYLAPPQNPDQAVSGTLSYALGCGKPVVSTSFAQAREDVTPEVGILVGFNESAGIRDALLDLLGNKEKREKMGMTAYFRTRSRTWQNVIINYMREYIAIEPELGKTEKNLPKIKLDHLIKMTDKMGLFQFAKLTEPDHSFGYTTDDNARALIAMVKYYELTEKPTCLTLIKTYLNFLEFVSLPEGGFHNYVNKDKTIHHEQQERENIENANSRAIYALAHTATSAKLPDDLRQKASSLFKKNFEKGKSMTSLRSMSYFIKSLVKWHQIEQSAQTIGPIEERADQLVELFNKNSDQNWKWFEDILAYSNGLMPDALLDAYRITKNEKYLSVAREAIEFLSTYSFGEDVCMPIGQSGWLKRGGKKTLFDQQPEEVAMLVLALKSIYQITNDENFHVKMNNAFNWFLGNNTLHQVVYDQSTGGCYDGLGEKNINLNQGAESTVMYLLARLAFE